MPSKSSLITLVALLLALPALILSVIAWSRINSLSLPLPVALPALNVLLPILTALATALSRRLLTPLKNHVLRQMLPYLAYTITLSPIALLILSLTYAVPSDLRSCASDIHWLRLFEHKDESSVRAIQTQLQCCGYNSMHDRAWPFPSRNTDARTCERTMGYTLACGGMWRHQGVVVAVLVAVASFLNWLLMVLVVFNFPQSEGQIRLPAWSDQHARLIGAGADQTEETEENCGDGHEDDEAEHNRIWNNEAERIA